jgi:hypothetical protein
VLGICREHHVKETVEDGRVDYMAAQFMFADLELPVACIDSGETFLPFPIYRDCLQCSEFLTKVEAMLVEIFVELSSFDRGRASLLEIGEVGSDRISGSDVVRLF